MSILSRIKKYLKEPEENLNPVDRSVAPKPQIRVLTPIEAFLRGVHPKWMEKSKELVKKTLTGLEDKYEIRDIPNSATFDLIVKTRNDYQEIYKILVSNKIIKSMFDDTRIQRIFGPYNDRGKVVLKIAPYGADD